MPWILKKRPLFLWFCRSTSEKQPFFLREKIVAIFTVYIGPRENDDKEYLFFLTSPGSASLLKGYQKIGTRLSG